MMVQLGGATVRNTEPHGPGLVIGGVNDFVAVHVPSGRHTDGIGFVHVPADTEAPAATASITAAS